MTRGQLGRELARVELTIAAAVTVAVGLMWLAEPAYMGGGPPPSEKPVVIAGLVGLVVGFAWMIRIYRANPEPDPHIWRYRK